MKDSGDNPSRAAGESSPGSLHGLGGIVDAAFDGQRLDKALEGLLPKLSLRARRRLFAAFDVLVDGVPRPMAHKVREGAALSLRALPREPGPDVGPDGTGGGEGGGPGERPELLSADGPYVVFYKPAGLHAESLGLGGGDSLEDWIGERFLDLAGLTLLTRLDLPTSGLILAARDADAAAAFRRLEDRGLVEKTYFCVARGRAPKTVIENALDTDNRVKTRVLRESAADPLRRTAVFPLAYDPDLDLTLIRAVIKKGARHQIRAHLAAAGHPLLGDALYGPGGVPGVPGAPGESGESGESGGVGLYLAHVRMVFPGFSAARAPGWRAPSPLLDEALARAAGTLTDAVSDFVK